MTLPANSELDDFILRLDYPDTEYGRNAQNVPDVTLLSPIWWDQ